MKTESLHRGWGRFAVVVSVLACFLSASSSAFAADFLAGAVSSFPTGWSVSGEAQPGDVATQSGSGDTLTLAFDLGDDQTLTYTAPEASDANGTADVVISNAVFTTAYEYPGVEAVGGIDSQAAICVYTNTTSGGSLHYYGWAGAYMVENDVTNLTWSALSGATPVEGATNTVTMSFNYTTTPATVTFKVGNTTLTPNPVQLANNTKTQVTGVSFSGTGSIGEMAGASAPPAPSTFTVNFYTNDLATASWTTNVPANTVPVYLAAEPTKAPTAEYTYTFAGWTNETVTVATKNLSDPVAAPTNYYAAFTATPVSYTLTWDLDGGTITSEADTYTAAGQVPFGTALSAPTVTKTGYTFGEWSPSVGTTMPAANTTYTATWNPATDITYTVKHYQQSLDGSYPAQPTDTDNLTGTTGAQTAAAAKNYTGFTAGTVTQTAIAADGSTVVTIQYTRNSYALTWNLDGGTITSEAGTYTAAGPVPFGTALAAPTVAKTGYTSGGWSPAVDATMPAAAASYTITWTPNTDTAYTVEHYQQALDGTYPSTPTDTDNLTGTTGEQTAATAKSYTGFTAGTVTQAAIAADGSTVVTIQYTRNSYQLTWSTDGDALTGTYTSGNVLYGASITAPATPTKTGATFKAWSPDFSGTMPAADTTYTATWTANTFTVYWVVNGTTVETDTDVAYNTTPTYNGETPTKTSTATTNYTFTVWSPEVGPITQDTTYTAQFSETARPYSLAWDAAGGNLSGEYTAAGSVANGAAITSPTATREGYTFNGWSPDFTGTMPAADTTYVAQWSEIVVPTLALAKPTLSSTVLANAQSGAVVRATIDPTATVNATNATADVVVDGTNATATFTSLPWNDPVDWMLQSAGAADLPGRFYAKGETPWFNVATDSLDTVTDLAEGMRGVDMSDDPSAAGQMVRIQTALEIAEGAMENLPTGNDVGEARTGFAVASLADDEGTAYFYAFNGSTWDKLSGAEPTPGTKDLLIVLDVEAATARYYVDGIALYKEIAGVRTHAIPMKAFENGETKQINGIGFANPDGVATNVVAEYDVPFEAAVGDVPYVAAADGLANADKTGAQTLYLLTNDVAGTIELNVGDIVKVDTTKGSFAQGSGVGLVSGIAAGYTLGVAADGNLTTYTVDLVEYPIEYVLGLAGATNAVANPTSYNVSSNFPIALLPAGCPDYTFNGWTNAAGAVVTEIAAGTTGAVTNWASWRRNAVILTVPAVAHATMAAVAGGQTLTGTVDGNNTLFEVDPGTAVDVTFTAETGYHVASTGDPAITLAVSSGDMANDFTLDVSAAAMEIDTYTVTFTWHDDSTSAPYEYGTPAAGITIPRDPPDYVENGKIYSFTGWSAELPATLTGNVTITAQYDSGVTAEAMVISIADAETGATTTNYVATLAAAFGANGAKDGDTVELLANVTLTERVEPNLGANTTLAIDLGGYTITRTGTGGNGSAFDVRSGDVLITNGVIDCTQDDTAIAKDGVYAITSRSGSNVTLADLTVTVDSECGACVYPFAGSTMTIESGTYANLTTTPYRYNTDITGMAVNQPNIADQLLIIKGGSFSPYDPQLGDDSGAMTDFTDDGFVAIQDGNGRWVVQPGYNVTFDANGGTPTPAAQRVAAGGAATEPTGVTLANHSLRAWQLSGADYDFDTVLDADIALVADWTIDSFDVIWVANGSEYASNRVDYGSAMPYPEVNPVKGADAQYTYAFDHWDPAPDETVTSNATYTAVFTETVNQYDVIWVADGAQFESNRVDYGTAMPVPATDPTKAGDANALYTFVAWTPAQDAMVTSNATYEASFKTWTKVAVPTAASDLVYDGIEKTGVAVAPNGEYTISDNTATDAGSYTATATLGDTANTVWADDTTAPTANAEKTVTWSIAKREIEITASDASKIAGNPDPVFTASITSGTLADGQEIDYTFTVTDGADAATKVITPSATITASGVDVTANYTITAVPGTLAIGGAEAMVISVANAETGATTTNYVATLADAFGTNGAKDGDTVELLSDVTLDARVEPNLGANTTLTIDLGGYTITRTGTGGNGSAFDVRSGDVLITNGVIDCTQDDTAIAKDGVYAITSRSGSNVTLADLTVTVDSECGACAYPFAGSTMTIESGTYANVTTTPYRYNTAITGMAVNQPNNATQNLVIKGGSFSQYDPQLGDDSGAMTDFTDDGFVAIDDGNGHFVVQAGYNVTFDANGGTPAPDAQRVAAGGTATAPTGVTKANHSLRAWQLSGADYDFDTVLDADIALVADWTIDSFDVIWVANGSEYASNRVDYGSAMPYPEVNPVKGADAQYTYAFDHWDPAPDATVTSNATYTAVFTPTVNQYDVIWVADGAQFESNRVDYGTAMPVPATNPTKAGDANALYTFVAWTPAQDAMVTSNATYEASFKTWTKVAVPTGTDYTYDGSSKTGVADGTGYTRSGDYAATDADSYTATVTLADPANTVWATDAAAPTATTNLTVSWSIAKAPLSDLAVTLQGWTEGDAANTPVVSGNAGGGAETITYSADGSTWSGTVPTTPGTYTVKVEVAETSNYLSGSATSTFVIDEIGTFTIIWLADDDTEIETTTVEANTSPSHAAPAKTDNTGKYAYEFAGWQDTTSGTVYPDTLPAATATATYKATYTQSIAIDLALPLANHAVDATVNGASATVALAPAGLLDGTEVATAPAGAAYANGTLSFSNLLWNAGTTWSVSAAQGEAPLAETAYNEGRFYAKATTELFTATTNDFVALDMGAAGVGYSNAVASAAGETVRVNTTIDVPEGGLDTPPEVGDAAAGFAVLQLSGDSAPAYYAYNRSGESGTWTRLQGVEPVAGEHDYLAVYDFAAATPAVRYYIDGVVLRDANGDCAIPLGSMTSLSTIAFGSADLVKDDVVAVQDVSYVAAVGETPYTNATQAVAAIGAALASADSATVTLLKDGVDGSVSLGTGKSVTVVAGSCSNALAFAAANAPAEKVVETAGDPATTVTYSVAPNTATIVWIAANGSTLYETNYVYGATPAYVGSDPTKDTTATTVYTFDGWSDAADGAKLDPLPAVNGPTNYYAHFSEAARAYTLTVDYTAPEGFDAPAQHVEQVANGVAYSVASPAVTGCTAAPALVSGTMPTNDVSVAVVYTAIDYTITWNYKAADGSDTYDETTVIWGQTPAHADPAGYVANNTMYSFLAWDTAPAAYDGTVAAYTATYSSTAAEATVFTVADNGATTNTVGYYATLADAVAAATNGCTVLVLDNVTLAARLDPNPGANTAITIDLGGNTITREGTSGNGSAFDVKSGDVTITNGTIVCTQNDAAIAKDGVYAITSRSGSNVTLADLTVTVDSECGACAYPFAGSTMTIESGTYANVTTTPYRYNTAITGMAVNQPNNATQNLFIKGGSFSQYDPQLGDDSGAMTDFTDDGFVAIDDGNGHFVVQAGYNVTFDANGGTPTPDAQRIAAGGAATEPTGVTLANHSLRAWQLSGADYDFDTVLDADIALVADWTIDSFDVIWVANGSEYASNRVDYGSAMPYPEVNPVKGADAQYTYAFDHWNPAPDETVTSNATYTAVFTETVNQYDVIWVADGSQFESNRVDYGTAMLVPATNPTKAATEQCTYEFASWYPEPTSTVTSNATYTAIFTETTNQYDVIWVADGSQVASNRVDYGTVTATLKPADPTKAGDANALYTFTGWGEIAETVTADATYTASFKTWTKVAVPDAETGLVYDGTEKTGVLAGAGYTLSGNTATNAGSYTATVTLADPANAVWADDTTAPTTATNKTVAWSIAPASMTITVADYSGEYDGASHALEATPSVAEGTTVEYKVGEGEWTSTVPSVKDVSDSTAVQIRATNANYTTATTNVTMTVTAKAVTVAAVNKTKVYDNDATTDPELTATVTGAVEGETIAYELSREAGQTVANYAITVTVGENPNYTVTPEGAIFSITAATVQIPAAPGNKEYNGAAQTAGATATDTYSVEDDGGTNVGDYTVTYELADTDNYTWSDGSTTNQVFGWSITQKALTLTADDQVVAHGAAAPTYTYTPTGLVSGDSLATEPTLTCAYAAGDAVGTYPIEISGAVAPNYAITYANGTLTVTSNAFTVIWLADDGTTEYGRTQVEWGDTPVFSGETPKSDPDGKYAYEFSAWTPTPGPVTEATNYVASFTQSIATPLALPLANHAVDATVDGRAASVAIAPVGAIDGISFGATPAAATLDDATGTLAFADLDWNTNVLWSVSAQQGADALAESAYNEGAFYAKPSVAWFTATTNQLETVADASDAAVAYTNAVASNEGEMVRVHTKIAVPAVGLSAAPATGSAKVGFAVLQLDGDTEAAYYAYGNGTWTKLAGAKPTEGDHDYLAVYDLAAETPTARYYIDGVALYAPVDGGDDVYALPLAANVTSLRSISFASKEMVKDDIVAEQDVSYVAAVGQTAYTNILAAVAAQAMDADRTLALLKQDVALAPVELDIGDAFVVDYERGSFTNDSPAVSGVDGYAVKETVDTENEKLKTYALDAIEYPIDYVLALASATNAVDNPPAYTVEDTVAFLPAGAPGYTFEGWTNAAGATVTGWAAGGSLGAVTNYASWQLVTYNIAYTLDGGAVDPADANPATYTVESPAIALENPAKTGYTFAGWTGTGLDGASTAVTIPAGSTGDRTYTATWSINDYLLTINYLYTNGTVAATQFTSNVVYDTTYSVDSPVIEGYTADQLVVSGTMGAEPVTVDVTYTIDRHTVTFVDEDGTTVLLPAAYYDYGTLAANVVKPEDPTKAATGDWVFEFAGWSPAVADVTADAVYTATYTSNATVATVITIADNGDGTATTNETYYASLADALDAAPTNSTVRLDADVSEPAVALDTPITLDLNGNTWIVAADEGGTTTNAVEVSAAVSVVDSSENGGGTIASAADPAVTVAQGGALTLDDGVAVTAPEGTQPGTAVQVAAGGALVVEDATVDGDVTVAGAGEEVPAGSVQIAGGTVNGDVNVLGGASVAVSGGAVTGDIDATGADSTVAVSGGDVEGGIVADNGAGVTVTDGSVGDGIEIGAGSSVAVSGGDVDGGIDAAAGSTVTISGGAVTGCVDADGTLTITGGTVTAETGADEPAISAGGTATISGGSVSGDVAVQGDLTISGNADVEGNVTATGEDASVEVAGGTVDGNVIVSGGADATVSGTGAVTGNAVASGDGSTVDVSGGSVANVTVSEGADATVSGGEVAGSATATGAGSTVALSGDGEVGGGVVAEGGAAATVTGGTADHVTATGEGSSAAVSGGEIDNGVSATGGASAEISGDAEVGYVQAVGGDVDITGGTVTGTVLAGADGTVDISGGSVGGQITEYDDDSVTVTGGHFADNPTGYLADGYVAILNGTTGLYDVQLGKSVIGTTITVAGGAYTGLPYSIGEIVALDGYVLTNNTDYTVAYTNEIDGVATNDNVNAGSVTAWISGKGEWIGTTNVTFQISKASLTVTADDRTVEYGTDPATVVYTVSVTGFVNGESTNVLAALPTATNATYTAATLPGTYDDAIVPSGGAAANYEFAYVPGDLIVTGDPIPVKPGDNFTEIDVAGGLKPVEVVTDGESGQKFVVRFRRAQTGVVYELVASTRLDIDEDQWKGVATGADADDNAVVVATETTSAVGDLVEFKVDMSAAYPVRFFKIRTHFPVANSGNEEP